MRQSFVSLCTGFIFIIASLAIPFGAMAKDKAKPENTSQDRIDILANVALTGGPITRVTMTQHYSRSYLYLEHASRSLTLIDVTDARHPSVVTNLDLPASEAGSILTAAGDTALISSGTAQPAPSPNKTMSIVSFADPTHPQTVKQFANVTTTALDEHRGLIFVANDEGLWILHRNPAVDPEVQERYAHEVLYNH
jgi:hypothetical protein